MARFKPQAHLRIEGEKTVYKTFKTYVEFKRKVADLIKEYDEVFLVRSRLGQWGEWFEYWELDKDGKPCVVKEGWS